MNSDSRDHFLNIFHKIYIDNLDYKIQACVRNLPSDIFDPDIWLNIHFSTMRNSVSQQRCFYMTLHT